MAGDFTLTLFKVLGIMFGAFALMLVLAISFAQMYIRRAAQNKIYAIFMDQKHLFSAMLKVDGDCIYYGKGETKEKYLLDPTKQFWVTWPPVATKWIGTPVRAHWYVRNRPQPLDPVGKGAGLTSRSLRMIGDEAMLKTTWKDVRDTAGGPVGGAKSNITTILLIVILVLGGFNIYMAMNLQKVLETMSQFIGVK